MPARVLQSVATHIVEQYGIRDEPASSVYDGVADFVCASVRFEPLLAVSGQFGHGPADPPSRPSRQTLRKSRRGFDQIPAIHPRAPSNLLAFVTCNFYS